MYYWIRSLPFIFPASLFPSLPTIILCDLNAVKEFEDFDSLFYVIFLFLLPDSHVVQRTISDGTTNQCRLICESIHLEVN